MYVPDYKAYIKKEDAIIINPDILFSFPVRTINPNAKQYDYNRNMDILNPNLTLAEIVIKTKSTFVSVKSQRKFLVDRILYGIF